MGEELIHFGILGMKWGRRKDNPSAAMSKGRAAYRDKNILNNMSKADLQDLVGRLNLEKQLGDLTGESKKGESFMSKLRGKMSQSVVDLAAGALTKVVKGQIDKMLNSKGAGSAAEETVEKAKDAVREVIIPEVVDDVVEKGLAIYQPKRRRRR